MQDFQHLTEDIENEIKPVISDDNFSGENGEILGLKNPKKVRGEVADQRRHGAHAFFMDYKNHHSK
jgi:hypothetical protein